MKRPCLRGVAGLAVVFALVVLTGASAEGPSIVTLDSPTHPLAVAWYSNDSPVFVWSTDEPTLVGGYSYVIDRSVDTVPDGASEGIATSAACPDLTEGVWYFHVRAEDAVGLWGPTLTRAVRIDTTAPVTRDDAPSGWQDHAVRVALTARDVRSGYGSSGVARTAYSVDGGSWRLGTSVTVLAPADHSGDGVHSVRYRSVDRAGNREGVQTARVRIDTRPPGFSWESVSPAVLHRTEPVRVGFWVGDLTRVIHASFRVCDAWGRCVAHRGGFTFAPGLHALRVPTTYADGSSFLPGLYRVTLRLTDAAGNVRVTAAAAFRDYRPARARVSFDLASAGPRVALTFDDGWDAAAWSSILSTLRARGVHATFFVNGCHVAGHPELARRTVADGNAIGAHTWTHRLTTVRSREEISAELRDEIALWWRVARVTPVPYFRPPYGEYDDDTLAVAGALGFARVIIWDVDPKDSAGGDPSVIAQRVLSHAHPGAIVLMHATPGTAGALPAIISGLRGRGYSIVMVPELFRAAGCR